MFGQALTAHNSFIEETRKERDKRREERIRENSAIVIQKYYRGYRTRTNVVLEFRTKFDSIIISEVNAIDLLESVRYVAFRFSAERESERFELLVRKIMNSVETGSPAVSYLSNALRKSTLVRWISITKWLLSYIMHYFSHLDPCSPYGSRILNVYLSFAITVTDYSRWAFHEESLQPLMTQLTNVFFDHLMAKGLFEKLHYIISKGFSRHSLMFTSTSLTGLFALAIRPLIQDKSNKNKVIVFASHILTVPGIILRLNALENPLNNIIIEERLCSRIIMAFHEDQAALNKLIEVVNGPYILCLIGNLIQLSLLEQEVLVVHCVEFCNILSRLLRYLGSYVGSKKSNTCSWHPILGWFAHPLDSSLQESMPSVEKQLHLLWNKSMVHLLFGDVYAQAELGDESIMVAQGSSHSCSCSTSHKSVKCDQSFGSDQYGNSVRHGLSQFLGQLARAGRKKKKPGISSTLIDNQTKRCGPHDLPYSLKSVCMLYCFTVASLKEIRNDILAGLTLGNLLPRMWRLISRCGDVGDWVKVLLDSRHTWRIEPHVSHLLHLFTASASSLLSILDDVELFQLKKSFDVDELCSIGSFFNQLIYETVMAVPNPQSLLDGLENKDGPKSTQASEFQTPAVGTLPCLFTMCLRLLSITYERDCRHQFTDGNFWLIPTLRISSFMSDLRKSKPHAVFLMKNVPHIIPPKERILLFRDRVREDKASLGMQTRMSWLTDDGPVGAVITVHRNRLVEDGYQQLANLSSTQLRMKIRVQFVNEMGLDEVGIDLDGVFKEFLEETLHRVFDPSLNLFRVTSDQRLYPSPSSHLQDNHLQLFEFLGKMLAKAIYEGIVVDVPFANFFLTQLLGREKTGCYSFLDELATLDKELYNSLSYIKHYDGDVADLEFTFSYTEDCLGQLVVHDLRPGGRYITVTNDLKISYVHRVAHFRMYKQIRPQTVSFIRGFYSILNPEWLSIFSPTELQKLISGDSVSVNIEDLKQHTRYSGGFHSNHRVIKWLWDILRRDFSDNERSLFLKFVTSCSRPPLLGFSNLEPPFCIRCVQYTNEDQDVGDTLSSVLKGFFGMGSRREEISRLPTTSTCFNLLKLPNYSSRSVLRDKLRYAIHSHAGFELS